jgi:hypothetical protein
MVGGGRFTAQFVDLCCNFAVRFEIASHNRIMKIRRTMLLIKSNVHHEQTMYFNHKQQIFR